MELNGNNIMTGTKTEILNLLDNLNNALEGEKTKQLLDEVPQLLKYKLYIQEIIENAKKEIDANGKTKEFEKRY